MTALDLEFVRSQYPAFSDPEASRWAHLENAGGSYVPRQVTERLTHFFEATKVQPYWAFGPSVAAGQAMDEGRAAMAAIFGVDQDAVHLGPSTTQNTYVLAQAIGAGLAPGDEIIVTNQDHEANVGAWRRLAAVGAVVKEWTVDPTTGLLDPADLGGLLSDRTRLLAVTHASNIAATINPVAELAAKVHALGAVIVVDGVSYAPHALPEVSALDCDVYLYSAYKTYGPHIGVMYVRPELAAQLPNQGHYFNEDKPTTRLAPAGPDHAEIGALAGVVAFYESVHVAHGGSDTADIGDRLRAVFALFGSHEETLAKPLLELLVDRDEVHLVGATTPDHTVRAPTIAFWTPRRASGAIYQHLIDAHVSCGHGHFYAHRLVKALGLDPADGVVRLSAVHYNTADEISRALEVLDAIL